jgi:hypothetical protein
MADYVPTDWVDFSTPVNAANLDKMEAGIDTAHTEIDALDARLDTVEAKPALPPVVNGQWVKGAGGVPVWAAIAQADVTGLVSALAAKEALVNKGAVNGYAPLGADQKVPLTNLPDDIGGGGGAELVFEGDYVPATEYQDGDYVMKDGVVFVCVGGPTTAPPDPTLWPNAGTAPSTAVTYGTSLPASPANGQEHILVDNLTAPTYQWRFRFNANATGLYKWEFVGGPPAIDSTDVLFQTTSATFVDASPVGPQIAVARAGVYNVRLNVAVGNTSGAGSRSTIGCAAGATPADDATAIFTDTGNQLNISGIHQRTMLAPGSFVMKYHGGGGGAGVGNLYRPSARLEVQPVRVA